MLRRIGEHMNAISVTQLNMLIKNTLSREFLLKNFLVQGTITNLKRHTSGHYYFTLKDEKSAIDVTIFASTVKEKGFGEHMENGLQVIVKGSVNFYEPWGRLNVLGTNVIIEQISALQLAFEALKKELTALGYFDDAHKQTLPYMPTCIGMVTSASGAVMHDILNVTRHRNPLVQCKLFSVPVQGEEAGTVIAKGISAADNDPEIDLIIVGRGGGSSEDLWCFNDRAVVEALYKSRTPTISAVGHETDFTLCDFAADVRASTPSHAAELAVLPMSELFAALEMKKNYLDNRMQDVLQSEKQKVMALFNRRLGIPTLQLINSEKNRLKSYSDILYDKTIGNLAQESKGLAVLAQKLEIVNPLHILLKGYSKAEVGGRSIRSVAEIQAGEELTVVFSDGQVKADVKEVQYGKLTKDL